MPGLSDRLRNIECLVIEGNQFHRALLCEALRALGAIHVQAAVDALEAQAHVAAADMEIVILDWGAAPLDALTFTKLIRCGSTRFRKDAAIILVTSHTKASDVLAAQAAGVDEILAKPFSTAGVAHRLEAVLFRRREFIETATYVGPSRRRKLSARNPRRRMADKAGLRVIPTSTIAEREQAAEQIRLALQLLTQAPELTGLQLLARLNHILDAALLKLDDLLIRAATRSLVTYLQGMGERREIDSRVVEAHLNAMASLVQLAPDDEGMRYKVVRALDLLVLRKLKSAFPPTPEPSAPRSTQRTWAL